MRPPTKPLLLQQMTNHQFETRFPDERACRTFLQRNRWPEGVRCPRCGNANVHEYAGREHHWNCYQCSAHGAGYRFSVLVGTPFESTNKPLLDWFRVIHMMLTSESELTTRRVSRVMGFGSPHTAHLMCHKIRSALDTDEFKRLMGGIETS